MKFVSFLLPITAIVGATAAEIVAVKSIRYVGSAKAEAEFNLDDELHIIDGSGLSAPLTPENVGRVTHAQPSEGTKNAWSTISAGDVDQPFFGDEPRHVAFEIVFDKTYKLSDLAVWGYHFDATSRNNPKTIRLDYGVGDFSNRINQIELKLPKLGSSTRAKIDGVTADRVRLTVTNNHQTTPGHTGGDRVSLAEIRFLGEATDAPAVAKAVELPHFPSGSTMLPVTSIAFTGNVLAEKQFGLNNTRNIVDGSGLSGLPLLANLHRITHGNASTEDTAWSTTSTNPEPDFFSSGTNQVSFELRFDRPYEISHLVSWGYHFDEPIDNNPKVIQIDYGVGNFRQSSGNLGITNPTRGEAIFTGLPNITADQVRVTVKDNYATPNSPYGGDRVGLSEVRFVGVPKGGPMMKPSSTTPLVDSGLTLVLRRR